MALKISTLIVPQKDGFFLKNIFVLWLSFQKKKQCCTNRLLSDLGAPMTSHVIWTKT